MPFDSFLSNDIALPESCSGRPGMLLLLAGGSSVRSLKRSLGGYDVIKGHSKCATVWGLGSRRVV
jgi:hypothetical protein